MRGGVSSDCTNQDMPSCLAGDSHVRRESDERTTLCKTPVPRPRVLWTCMWEITK